MCASCARSSACWRSCLPGSPLGWQRGHSAVEDGPAGPRDGCSGGCAARTPSPPIGRSSCSTRALGERTAQAGPALLFLPGGCRAELPMSAGRALVTGISGQDGSYLAELLLDKSYEVCGVVRGAPDARHPKLAAI